MGGVFALTVLPLFSCSTNPSHKLFDKIRNIGDITMCLYGLVMVVVLVLFVLRRKRWITVVNGEHRGSVQQTMLNATPYAENNAKLLGVMKSLYARCHKNKLIGLIVFGIGTSASLAVEMLHRYYCWLNWLSPGNSFPNPSILFAGGLIIVLWIAQFSFLVTYSGKILQKSVLFYYLIAILIIGNIWILLFITFEPLIDVICGKHTCIPKTESNGTSSSDIVDKARHLLEPFVVEFLTISLGVLFGLFNKMTIYTGNSGNNTASRSVFNQTSANREALSGHFADANFRSVRLTTNGQRVVKGSVLIIALLFLLGYIAVYIVLSRHFQDDHDQDSQNIYIWEGIRVGFYIPQCALIYILQQRNSRNASPKVRGYQHSEYVLLCLNTVIYVYNFLRVFSAMAILLGSDEQTEDYPPSDTETVFILFVSLCGILQAWSQTRYFLAMSTRRESTVDSSMLHKLVLLYTWVLNVAEWSIHSLGHQWAEGSSDNLLPLFTYVFGNFTTQLLKLTFYRLWLFILSIVLLWRMKLLTIRLENNVVELY